MSLKPYLLSLSVAAALAASAGAQATRFDLTAVAGAAKGMARQQAVALQSDSDDSFETTDVIVDPDGTEHVRMQRSYRGLPVIGGDVVMHSNNGRFRGASLTLHSRGRPNLAPRTSADEALLAAGKDFNGDIENIESKGLVDVFTLHAAGRTKIIAVDRKLDEVNEAFDAVLSGRIPARVVFQF